MVKSTETVRSLDFLKTMPMTRWAWEFLRRNPTYIDDFSRHFHGALERSEGENGVEILRLSRAEPEAEKWGLNFFTSPNQTALTAPVFWTESASPHVVMVEAVACTDGDGNALFNRVLRTKPANVRRILFVGPDGHEQVLLQRGNRVVQLRSSGQSLLNDNVQLRFILEGFGDIDAKFTTIRRLAKFYGTFKLPPENPSDDWTPTAIGLRDALIALDVFQSSGSHQDAAIAIHGKRYADKFFSDADSPLKSRMKRLRKKAIELMDGGYIDLMK